MSAPAFDQDAVTAVDLFEQQGAVQLYVESIQPAGFGDLAIRFEELKARLSAEGRLYTCLFGARGHDLRAPLRLGASDEELVEQLRGIWTRRTDRYSELRTAETASLPKVEMSYIGG